MQGRARVARVCHRLRGTVMLALRRFPVGAQGTLATPSGPPGRKPRLDTPRAPDAGDEAALEPSPRPGLAPRAALALVLLALLVQGARLSGPFPDGQHGNCGAMFAIMARNARALGFVEGGAVPLLHLVPPAPGEARETYSHHPPGLPWLVMAADHTEVTRNQLTDNDSYGLAMISYLTSANAPKKKIQLDNLTKYHI